MLMKKRNHFLEMNLTWKKNIGSEPLLERKMKKKKIKISYICLL